MATSEEQENGLLRSKHQKVDCYLIRTAKTTFAMPKRCACCFGMAEDTDYGMGMQSRQTTLLLEVPICRDCKRHGGSNNFLNIMTLVLSGQCIAAIVEGIIFGRAYDLITDHCSSVLSMPTANRLVIGLAIGVPAISVTLRQISRLFPFRELSAECANRVKPVDISRQDGQYELCIYNPRWAEEFAALNQLDLTTKSDGFVLYGGQHATVEDEPLLRVLLIVASLLFFIMLFLGVTCDNRSVWTILFGV